MDTMESTKIVGGLCAALLVFLLAGWAAETMYHVGSSGHGDGEEHVSGYPIEVAAVETGGDDEPEMTLDQMMAAADADKGKKVFSKCKACHKVEDGANGTGPYLFNVLDRRIGGVAGYEYSGAMASFEGDWDFESLNAFLIKPSAYINGTKMSFAGLKKEMDRANVIKYLESLK